MRIYVFITGASFPLWGLDTSMQETVFDQLFFFFKSDNGFDLIFKTNDWDIYQYVQHSCTVCVYIMYTFVFFNATIMLNVYYFFDTIIFLFTYYLCECVYMFMWLKYFSDNGIPWIHFFHYWIFVYSVYNLYIYELNFNWN